MPSGALDLGSMFRFSILNSLIYELSFGTCLPPSWEWVRPDKETVTQWIKPTLLPSTTCPKLQTPYIRLYPPTLPSPPAPGSSLVSYLPKAGPDHIIYASCDPSLALYTPHPTLGFSISHSLQPMVRARKPRRGTRPGTCTSLSLLGLLLRA